VKPKKMDDSREEIEESLENLLIFPTREGLRRSIRMIQSYFSLEVQLTKDKGVKEQQLETIVEKQQRIVKIATDALDRSQVATSKSCESG
jgi:5'-deoxynucleotidase YfbR-like HD superfamily hydrolase